MSDVNGTQPIHIRLAEAMIERDQAIEAEKVERAAAEYRCLEAHNGDEKALGSNAEARARTLTLALSADSQYQKALDEAENCRADVQKLQAELAVETDRRRDRHDATLNELAAAIYASVGLFPRTITEAAVAEAAQLVAS